MKESLGAGAEPRRSAIPAGFALLGSPDRIGCAIRVMRLSTGHGANAPEAVERSQREFK
jgi:hypothetical protein